MDAADNTITMQNNLPIIDYNLAILDPIAIQRCPTGAIVWLESDGTVVEGKESKAVIRQTPLLAMPS